MGNNGCYFQPWRCQTAADVSRRRRSQPNTVNFKDGLAKALAKELHYTENVESSTAMNVWLHKQVMIKLAENRGKVLDLLKV